MKKIAFICQPEYFRFTYENDLNSVYNVREFKLNYNMQEDDYSDLIEYDADYNIFYRGEFVPPQIIHRLKGLSIALSSEPFPRLIDSKWYFTEDSIKRYEWFRKIRHINFDYVFHYDNSSMELFKKDGLNISGSFVFPVATGTYHPTKTEKIWDIMFIGRSTEHRELFFTELKHDYKFLHIAHGIWGKELVDYINKSRICLNIHASNEISLEPRMQMLIASGAFVITEKISPNSYLKENVDYQVVTSPEQLKEKVNYFLKYDDEREELALEASLKIRKTLNSRDRFTELLKNIDKGKFSRFESVPSDIIDIRNIFQI